MTSFFEHQDRARRNTRLLVWLMVLAVLAIAAAIYGLAVFLELWGSARMHNPAFQPQLLQPQLLLACLLGTAALVLLASGSRVLSLRGGGASIAEMLGGRLVSGNPQDLLEKRLLNVVEEMAIASGVPVPQVFVLDSEAGINAFAAGFSTGDAAIAATRGCIEKLSRDELQGVIAHEFSHVLNGDMRLNIRLMGVVFGIVCIGLFGRFLIRIGGQSSFAESSSRRKGGSPGTAILVFGIGVFLIGTIGELFGKLIKAAVSRQREFLADASAVQFTRNPAGIAGALKKIGGYSEGAKMSSPHADEASHFFFGDIHKRLFAQSVFATHPPLAERIGRIDPTFHGEFPAVAAGIAEPEDLPISGFSIAALPEPEHAGEASASSVPVAALSSTPACAQDVVGRVGVRSVATLNESKRLLAALSPQLRQAAQSPFSASAIVYALLLDSDAEVRKAQRAQLDALAGAHLHVETLRMELQVRVLARRDRLPLVAICAPALRELSRDQRAVFSRTVQALMDADEALSIFESVLGHTLRTRLEDRDGAQARSRIRHRTLASVRNELELLLSLLAHAGDFDGSGANKAFAEGASRLPDLQVTLLPPNPRLLSGLGVALIELGALSPQLGARVVDACAYTVMADQRITDDEESLLRVVCDALGAPLPPLDGATQATS